jgi:hypothetical protein
MGNDVLESAPVPPTNPPSDQPGNIQPFNSNPYPSFGDRPAPNFPQNPHPMPPVNMQGGPEEKHESMDDFDARLAELKKM